MLWSTVAYMEQLICIYLLFETILVCFHPCAFRLCFMVLRR